MGKLIVYRMEVVGGPFDGCGGMRWHDDGTHPPPEIILMGLCPGDGSCVPRGTERCTRVGKKHPYYWLPEETTQPPKTVEYELSENFIDREEPMKRSDDYPGRAIYTIGGLQLPREQEARELVGAGAQSATLDADPSLPGRSIPMHARG